MLNKEVTLRNSMWRYFVLFTVIIFVLLWIFQIMLFGTSYVTMKKNEINALGNLIAENFKEANLNKFEMLPDFKSSIERNFFAAGSGTYEI